MPLIISRYRSVAQRAIHWEGLMKTIRKMIVLVGILGVFAFVLLGTQTAEASGFAVKEGETAPDFTLHDQNNEAIQLSSLRGQWVVLYFYPETIPPAAPKRPVLFETTLPPFSVSKPR